MRKPTFLSILVVVMLLLCAISPVAGAQLHNEARVQVTIQVPIIQQIYVVKPVVVSIPLTTEVAEPIVITDVGQIAVKSNADWELRVHADATPEFEVSVKPGSDPLAEWRPVDAQGASFIGKSGAHDLSWDIKVDTSNGSRSIEGSSHVGLIFTLSQV